MLFTFNIYLIYLYLNLFEDIKSYVWFNKSQYILRFRKKRLKKNQRQMLKVKLFQFMKYELEFICIETSQLIFHRKKFKASETNLPEDLNVHMNEIYKKLTTFK